MNLVTGYSQRRGMGSTIRKKLERENQDKKWITGRFFHLAPVDKKAGFVPDVVVKLSI